MLRIWVFTVLTETDSSLAISGRERLAGRNHSTLGSLGLSGSTRGDRDCSLGSMDKPRMKVQDVGQQCRVSGLVARYRLERECREHHAVQAGHSA